MKIGYFYRTLLPLLLTFFNVIGTSIYSYNPGVPDLDPRNNDYLQEDQNTSALYLEESSISILSQVNSKNDLVPGGNFIGAKGISNSSLSFDNKLTSIIIRDKKEILKSSIFPSHFFW